MPQIYYDNFGVKVTDTMFIAPTGDQYPIRNISSVQVRIQSGLGALIAGIIFILCGPLCYYLGLGDNMAIICMLFGVFSLIGWKFYQLGQLLIGSGGTTQVAIALNVKKADKKTFLNDVSNAINTSISNLQST